MKLTPAYEDMLKRARAYKRGNPKVKEYNIRWQREHPENRRICAKRYRETISGKAKRREWETRPENRVKKRKQTNKMRYGDYGEVVPLLKQLKELVNELERINE